MYEVSILIAGEEARGRVRRGSVQIHDELNDAPNTCRMTMQTERPVVDQPIRVTIDDGGSPARLLFNGTHDQINESYEGKPARVVWQAASIDDQRLTNARLPFGSWSNVSASDVAAELVADFAPDFTATHVQADLPAITLNLDGSEGMNGALSQIAKLIGGYFYWFDGDLHLFTEEADETPDPVDADHRPLDDPPISVTRDPSQMRTRVYGKGHGEGTLYEVPAGEDVIPLADATMFDPLGGRAITDTQRLEYTGVQLGGGGGLVGPGAAPSGAVTAALAAGAGVTTGDHEYGVTFVTGAGESLASPRTAISVGHTPAPGTAPDRALASGGSVDAGAHEYAVTFVTASGETTPGPSCSPVTTGGAAASPPSSAPTVGTPTPGGAVDGGTHKYTVTYVQASGETPAGPDSSTITANAALSTPGAPTAAEAFSGSALPNTVTYKYRVTYQTSGGETDGGTITGAVSISTVSANGPPSVSATTGGSLTQAKDYYYAWTVTTAAGESLIGSAAGVTVNSPNNAVQVNGIVGGVFADARITGRKVYRATTNIGAGPPASSAYKLVHTINDTTTTSWTDTGASDGATAPSSNTTGFDNVSLTSIPTGGSRVTGRRIYRADSSDGYAQYKRVGTISDNSTTTFTDNTTSPSVNIPTSNTTNEQTVALSSIPTGPAGTTARKVYRTAAGGSTYKLLTTISNNSTTTYSDTTADASLGATLGAGATLSTVALTNIPTGDATVTSRKVYRTEAGGSTLKLLTTIGDNSTTTYTDTSADASLGANAPASNTATANQVSLTNIPIGAATVTARKVYRTTAGGSTLKLVTTIANNTGTTYTDSTADGSLGADAPSSDTSGLPQPAGQVNPGETSLIVAGLGAFDDAGGWAVIGNGQILIRYTGRSSTALTGIPASGVGSIIAAIAYNSTVTAAPALTGVTGLDLDLIRGAPVNIWVQRDDLIAQDLYGIIEHRIVDERRGIDSLEALCDADLALFAKPVVTCTYATRDVKTKSGKPVTIDLDSPAIHETLVIQTVDISEIDIAPNLAPKFTVTASSVRFSLEDVLRRLASGLAGK